MKTMTSLKHLVLLSAVLAALMTVTACGQQATDEVARSEVAEPAPATAEPAVAETASAPTEAVVALSGTMGCGHCNFQITDGCAPAFEAEDGSKYVIQAAEADQAALMEARTKGGGISVTGTVSEVNGVLTVVADGYQLQEKVESVG